MKAYYNEFDPGAAAWLRELIQAGLIAPGDVDDRSITDVRPNDLTGYGQCHFFAGIGGWSLALRSAGVPDHFPIWTGSCPCQPFSAAGKRAGFADERHLWPFWRYLIAQRRHAIVFGEQVAAASDWLRLVRGDLEAMEYAMGAMPVEAASAGADHLRDRFWFVADDGRRRRAGSRERQVQQQGRAEAERASHFDVADDDDARLQGRALSAERADQRLAWPDGVADAHQPERRIGDQQPARQQPEHERDAAACDGGDLAHANCQSEQRRPVDVEVGGKCLGLDWAIGADGKARRVKSGVRLLADGFPERMGLLRGFGNAIDPRPAAAFIRASIEALTMI